MSGDHMGSHGQAVRIGGIVGAQLLANFFIGLGVFNAHAGLLQRIPEKGYAKLQNVSFITKRKNLSSKYYQ